MKNQTHVDPRTGRTIKSGLNLYRAGEQDHFTPRGTIYRAVVLRTFATDDTVRTEGQRKDSTRLYEVECDILLTRSLVPKPRVPVMQSNHGVNDGKPWIPRPSTRVIGGGDLNLTRVSRRGTPGSLPPNLEDLDGDQVLVQFIEGDPEHPIIVGAATHTKTKRLVVNGSGWDAANNGSERGQPHLDESYERYRGTEVRINDQGDMLIDTVGANPVDNDDEVPALTGGALRLRVKGNQRYTLEFDGTDVMEVWVDPVLGPQAQIVPGSEQFIRGTTHAANLSAFLSSTTAFTDLAAKACAAGDAASVGPLAAYKVVWAALGNAFAAWGGMDPPPVPGSTVIPIPPAVTPVGVFSATLVDGQALSTKIRGD